MKNIVTLASVMLACFVSFADNPYSVQYTVSGYSGTEALTNFPVLVRLSAGSPLGFSYADCAAGGADLTFTDDAGNVIPREIDTWNTSGESLVWVCVPVVTNGASFTLHYGDTSVAAQHACQTDGSVWSGANFKGVWHMDSMDPADSSPNGYDGTHQAGNLSVVPGALGAAVYFPRAAASDGISCGNVLTNSELTGGFTIEGWCRPTQYGGMGDGAAMFGKNLFVSLRINCATNVTLTTPGKADHKMYLDSGVLPAVNEWWHFVATFKMNTADNGLNFYVNGQLVKTMGAGDINNKKDATTLYLGNNQWDQAFKGDLDELRLSAGIRSADWVAASYATQHATDFLSAGPRINGGEAPVLANAAATPGCTDAQVSVRLSSVGAGATSAAVTFAYGPEGGALSAPVVLAAAATDGQTLTTNLTGLAVGTAYRYVFTAENNLSDPLSRTMEGTFSTFAYRAAFTVTGYTGTEVLTNFPALVRLANNSPRAFKYTDCAAGGADLRFTDEEGRLIPHEIETWDTTGESLIWVGLPIATNGTTFTMYYRSDAPGTPSADDVWTNYVAVVHGGTMIANAVAGGQTVTAEATVAAADAGIVGGGIRKDAAKSIGVNVANPSEKLSDSGKYSVSAWFKRNGNGGNGKNTHILSATRPEWGSGTGYVWLQEQGKYISISAPNGSGGGTHQFTSGKYTLPDGAWAHAAFTYDSGVALTTYFNGAQDNQKTTDLGDLVNISGFWTFGSYANAASDDSLKGDMDEIRIYNGVASGDRIKAEYDSMASESFLTADPSTAGLAKGSMIIVW